MSLFLTQSEADFLLFEVVKNKIDETEYKYHSQKCDLVIPLLSEDKKHSFTLDIWRSYINLTKGRYQTRTHRAIILARIDFGGSPHRNPDGKEIGVPHIHIYKEHYMDKWAYELPYLNLTENSNTYTLLYNFMNFCKIVKKPNITEPLFN